MKLIRTEDAAGQVLCHDITQIIPGEFKGARFRKGHIIQPEDIPVLLSIGKENLYVWEKKPGILHEDEAAALLYKAAAGRNIHGTEPKEGKIELIADCDGLLKINREALLAVNRTPQMMIATIHGDLPVKKGQKLAGTRIIPLVIEQEKMDAMQAAAGSTPILNVLPMQAKKFAVITTGSEVFKGRIEDKFTPILVGKLAEYGERIQSDIRFMGVPKTIDNDLMVTDHTPGYGSAAKYIGVVMKEIIRDATVYGTKYVTVVEIMGRNAGWLTAAAALAKSDDCEGVDMICLPEVPFNVEHFVEKVRVMQEKKPSIVIAVSEGVKLEDGRYVCELADDVHAVDAFGHKALTGTARYLANVVARNLDTKTRCIELSTLQRCAGHLTSRTDITEAYQVGGAAVKAAFEGVTGQMVALKRISNSPYQCTTELHPISEVANLEKKVPLSWMNENHTQMTEDFLAYARPLIQAELTPLYIAGLPHHIYMKPQK